MNKKPTEAGLEYLYRDVEIYSSDGKLIKKSKDRICVKVNECGTRKF